MIASLRQDVAALQSEVGVLRNHVVTLRTDQSAVRNEVAVNTAITRRIETNTQTIVTAVAGAAAMWEFLALWAGRARRWSFFTAKWVGVVAGAFVAVWAAVHAVFGVDLTKWIVANGRFWR